MSTLYRVKIENINDTKVTAQVKVTHPDAGSNIASKDFVLQILLDTGHIDRPYFDRLPIKEDEWKKLVAEHPKREEYDMLHLWRDGEELSISEEDANKRRSLKYWHKHNDEIFEKYGRKVQSGGSRSGHHYVVFESEPLKVIDAAKKIIVSRPEKTKIAKDVYNLDFEVADAAYLYHLREKMLYETASFNLASYYKPEIKVEAGEIVLLTYKDDKSNKFWQVEQDGATLNISYGKTGTAGQKNVKEFDSVQKAEKERDKLITEKLGKGYVREN